MSIRQISYSLIGAFLMTGMCLSCENTEYRDKAKAQAAEYLNGYDLLRAERNANQQYVNSDIYAAEVAYWDSLLIEAKSKEAYIKGQQMVRDSADGKFFRINKYKANLDTLIDINLINNVRQEYSKYVDAKTFIKQRENVPTKENHFYDYPFPTHYWDLITIAAKQQEAYNKGAKDERIRLNAPKN